METKEQQNNLQESKNVYNDVQKTVAKMVGGCARRCIHHVVHILNRVVPFLEMLRVARLVHLRQRQTNWGTHETLGGESPD